MNELLSSNMAAAVIVFVAGIALGALIVLKAHKQPDSARDALTKGFQSSKGARQASSRHDNVESIEKTADMASVQRLLRENRKIEAIKELRSQTGLGLAEAKSVIDQMCAEKRY